jgi:hypothetical protein
MMRWGVSVSLSASANASPSTRRRMLPEEPLFNATPAFFEKARGEGAGEGTGEGAGAGQEACGRRGDHVCPLQRFSNLPPVEMCK